MADGSEKDKNEEKEGSQSLRENLVCVAGVANVCKLQTIPFIRVDRRRCEISKQSSSGRQPHGPEEVISEKER